MSPPPEKSRVRRLNFLLHAHLPYGFCPERQTSLEQVWLYEAVTNCYLPLLSLIQRLDHKESPWFTISLSPTLLELWSQPEFVERYKTHLQNGLRLIESESKNRAHPDERRKLARQIMAQWKEAEDRFDAINGRLPAAFSHLAEAGKIELITTAATHPFLPAFQNDSSLRRFQIGNGIKSFKRHTGISPKGFWLPECAYYNGLEKDLAPFGIEYFGLEEQGLTRANPPTTIRKPLACPNGLLALARDNALSQKVWNARSGYPGHPRYREFHHDGIHQVDTETCGQFALPDGGRLPFGLKYWRVSGKSRKDWYEPDRAGEQAELDAKDFIRQIESVGEGLIFLPFDAELFGHWWYEGPVWLEQVLRLANDLPNTSLDCCHQAAKSFKNVPPGQPAASTWGRKSDYSFWINRDTDWIYTLLHRCSHDLGELVRHYGPPRGNCDKARAIRQAGRELLQASASDWPFMLRAGATGDYALERLDQHIKRFHYLIRSVQNNQFENEELNLLEQINPAFKEISFTAYSVHS